METISMSKMQKMSATELKDALPLTITVDGEEVATITPVGQNIFIGDLHPRVQISLRAIEAKVRAGMPR